MSAVSANTSPVSIGARTVHEGVSQAAAYAERISAESAQGEISVEGFLGLQASARQVRAGAALIRVGEELQDRVLDIIA